MVSLIESQD